MKTLLKILLGLIAFVMVAAGVAFWATSDLPKAADGFFSKIAAGDYDGAMTMTTPDFRASTDRQALEAFVRSQGIDGYRSASWSSRSIENNLGKLEGNLNVADGGLIPITVQLVKADGEWRIQNLRKPDAGIATSASASAPALPSVHRQQRLVADTLDLFAQGVQAGDFSALHRSASEPFQRQIGVERLREAFASFVEQQIDLGMLGKLEPRIDASSGMLENGLLRLVGDYPGGPDVLLFDLKYAPQDGDWRLIEIDVKVR